MSTTQLDAHGFGAVTLHQLPDPDRLPNAITAAPDGSVWNLYRNGTLVEYPWPVNSTRSSSQGEALKTLIWGIAAWNGSMRATDGFGKRLVGPNPCTGATKEVDLPASDALPYTLTVRPDGSLWFGKLLSASAFNLGCARSATTSGFEYRPVFPYAQLASFFQLFHAISRARLGPEDFSS